MKKELRNYKEKGNLIGQTQQTKNKQTKGYIVIEINNVRYFLENCNDKFHKSLQQIKKKEIIKNNKQNKKNNLIKEVLHAQFVPRNELSILE